MKLPTRSFQILRPINIASQSRSHIRVHVHVHKTTRNYTTPSSPPKLQGSNCIITGASRGIGKAIALAFAKNGASCTLIGRNETLLVATLKELKELNSDQQLQHTYQVGDVQDSAFWKSLSSQSKPPVHILVNAAGIAHSSLLIRTTESSIEEIMQTNLMGTLWACRSIGKKMLKNKILSDDSSGATGSSGSKGCIINVASLLAVHGGTGSAAYVASKAGVVGLTRALAAEMGQLGVRVNAVLPGYIETDMTAAMNPEARESALSRIPLKRFGTTEEVADAAIFLAQNSYANNCVLNLDGGLSAT